jgi:hypothetical protein
MTTVNFCSRFIVRGDIAMTAVAGDVAESSDQGRRAATSDQPEQGYGFPSGSSPSQGSIRSEWSGRSSAVFASSIS